MNSVFSETNVAANNLNYSLDRCKTKKMVSINCHAMELSDPLEYKSALFLLVPGMCADEIHLLLKTDPPRFLLLVGYSL